MRAERTFFNEKTRKKKSEKTGVTQQNFLSKLPAWKSLFKVATLVGNAHSRNFTFQSLDFMKLADVGEKC